MAETAGASKTKSVSPLLLLFAVFNLATLGGGAFLAFKATLGYKPPILTNERAEHDLREFESSLRGEPALFHLEPFSTNLDGVPHRLVRLEVSLEMLDDEGLEEIVDRVPDVRDRVVRILNGKTFSDLESVQGKLALKSQIIADLNRGLERGAVKDLLFQDLVVQ